MIKNTDHLYIFNLSTDSNDELLAFTQDWVLSFSQILNKVSVISTWVGKNKLPKSIPVRQIGGGTTRKRISALSVLLVAGIEIIRDRKHAIIFHHMSPRTAVILGPIFRIFGIKQGLWFSHSKCTIELKIAEKIVNRIFSSVQQSLPMKSTKACFTGHGIKVESFTIENNVQRILPVLSVGRIAPIKNNEALIDAISESKRECKEIHLAGPIGGAHNYLQLLIEYGVEKGVKILHLGQFNHSSIAQVYSKYSICYTGSPNTIDKSVIEGALCGVYTLSAQQFVLNQTGMSQVLELANIEFSQNLTNQIENLDLIKDREDLRTILHNCAAEHNSLSNTTKKIIEEIKRS